MAAIVISGSSPRLSRGQEKVMNSIRRLPRPSVDLVAVSLRKDIDAETFRRLVLCNDGLPIDPNKL
jgi:hypothetical protein